MARIFLGGQGSPISEIAIPTNESDDAGGLWLVLHDGDVFRKRDWLNQGYTNFDVYAIGAAGGRGGDAYGWISWPYFIDASEVRHYHDPQLSSVTGETGLAAAYSFGGAGGGGGMHHIRGVLEELPDEVLVSAGQAGADGAAGFVGNDQVTPGGEYDYTPYTPDAPSGGVYDDPHATFYPPTDGEDGGFTTFGDLAQASGGKGGKRSELHYLAGAFYAPHEYTHIPGGNGGQGGIGGQLTPGGGGAGATSLPPLSQYSVSTAGVWTEWLNNALTQAVNGTWNGRIGQGGGGGRGGTLLEAATAP